MEKMSVVTRIWDMYTLWPMYQECTLFLMLGKFLLSFEITASFKDKVVFILLSFESSLL
jgi:hypothetical protein